MTAPAARHPVHQHIPGNTDLEKLENLKDIIKNGQHAFYRAVPRPDALAQVYLGPLPPGTQHQHQQQQEQGRLPPYYGSGSYGDGSHGYEPSSSQESSERMPESSRIEKFSVSDASSGTVVMDGPVVRNSGSMQNGDGLNVAQESSPSRFNSGHQINSNRHHVPPQPDSHSRLPSSSSHSYPESSGEATPASHGGATYATRPPEASASRLGPPAEYPSRDTAPSHAVNGGSATEPRYDASQRMDDIVPTPPSHRPHDDRLADRVYDSNDRRVPPPSTDHRFGDWKYHSRPPAEDRHYELPPLRRTESSEHDQGRGRLGPSPYGGRNDVRGRSYPDDSLHRPPPPHHDINDSSRTGPYSSPSHDTHRSGSYPATRYTHPQDREHLPPPPRPEQPQQGGPELRASPPSLAERLSDVPLPPASASVPSRLSLQDRIGPRPISISPSTPPTSDSKNDPTTESGHPPPSTPTAIANRPTIITASSVQQSTNTTTSPLRGNAAAAPPSDDTRTIDSVPSSPSQPPRLAPKQPMQQQQSPTFAAADPTPTIKDSTIARVTIPPSVSAAPASPTPAAPASSSYDREHRNIALKRSSSPPPRFSDYREDTRPRENTYRPPPPSENNYKPPENNYRPPESHYRPAENNYRPVEQNYRPVENTHRPVENNYRPVDNNYRPTENNYRPTENNYRPPENSYRPVENNYRPADNNYRPVENGARPPQENNYRPTYNDGRDQAPRRDDPERYEPPYKQQYSSGAPDRSASASAKQPYQQPPPPPPAAAATPSSSTSSSTAAPGNAPSASAAPPSSTTSMVEADKHYSALARQRQDALYRPPQRIFQPSPNYRRNPSQNQHGQGQGQGQYQQPEQQQQHGDGYGNPGRNWSDRQTYDGPPPSRSMTDGWVPDRREPIHHDLPPPHRQPPDSRLSDSYPSSVPPPPPGTYDRDYEASRRYSGPPPPFSGSSTGSAYPHPPPSSAASTASNPRVRPRSPSPVGMDHQRRSSGGAPPPMKRAREDPSSGAYGGPPSGYYDAPPPQRQHSYDVPGYYGGGARGRPEYHSGPQQGYDRGRGGAGDAPLPHHPHQQGYGSRGYPPPSIRDDDRRPYPMAAPPRT